MDQGDKVSGGRSVEGGFASVGFQLMLPLPIEGQTDENIIIQSCMNCNRIVKLGR